MEEQAEQLKAKIKHLQRKNAELFLLADTVQTFANAQTTEQVIDKLLGFCIELTGAQRTYFLSGRNGSRKREAGKYDTLSSETYDALLELVKGKDINLAIECGVQNDFIGIVSNFAVIRLSREEQKRYLVLVNFPLIANASEYVEVVSKIVDSFVMALKEKEFNQLLKASENDLREANQRLNLMAEKLRVVGSLTRHDVKNKLMVVSGNAYLLKKKHLDQVDVVDGLGKMEQTVGEIGRIFDFAKLYEQLGAEQLTDINVEEKLNEACKLFSEPLPRIINECKGLTVLADSFLRQLFYNFIDNTKKYGKKTTIIRVHYERANQDSLKLVYEDDGVGIAIENKSKLFTEGFSTGGSTGFGLFLTKKMVDVYGWEIEENGEPGKSAKFTMSIPRINKNGKENYQIVP